MFAAALKRVNTELGRLHNLAARTANVEAARKALALHRAANFITYPPAGATADEGMVPKAIPRRRRIITGAKIGRVSQATKIAQAIRDARGGLAPAHRKSAIQGSRPDLIARLGSIAVAWPTTAR